MLRDRRGNRGAPYRATPPVPGPVDSGLPIRSVRRWLVRTLPGRVLVLGIAGKLLVLLLEPVTGRGPVLQTLSAAATLAVILALSYLAFQLIVRVKRRLLWRVRRKLILSYLLIGFIPALLLISFFLFSGALAFFSLSSYIFKTGFDKIADDARLLAGTTAVEIMRETSFDALTGALVRKREAASERYPGVSFAIVPHAREADSAPPVERSIIVGPWRHLEPPTSLPAWVSRGGFTGLLAHTPADTPQRTELVVRSVMFPEIRAPGYGIVVDIPIDEPVIQTLREATGIELNQVGVSPVRNQGGAPAEAVAAEPAVPQAPRRLADSDWRYRNWMTFLEYTDWATGQTGSANLSIRIGVQAVYHRLAAGQARFGTLSLADLFVFVLVVIAGLFLIIEIVALFMGLALARSITGSVHELFTGTERVRQGDFGHRIRVRTQDQLGELAESFNNMTGSIEELLQQAAEKRRLEEELRIARDIQMSLLPRGPLLMPGLSVSAVCEPAREVGGDYYDFFPLDERRLGLLIADVSGKGTSAALYMAELKGLMLSLSKIYQSPRRLLIAVNQIISANLDSRSFITMTYAMLDLEARTLTYARAGHTPLIYLAAADHGAPRAEILAPDGLVLGLCIPGMVEKFEELLEESVQPIGAGDVFVLFTDGITETMNLESELFGEQRLQHLIEEHAHLPSDELRERILRDIQSFAGGAAQHDDMTMILVKIEDVGAPAGRILEAAGRVVS
jgi:phosphoserine phosphatase RsbU/P